MVPPKKVGNKAMGGVFKLVIEFCGFLDVWCLFFGFFL